MFDKELQEKIARLAIHTIAQSDMSDAELLMNSYRSPLHKIFSEAHQSVNHKSVLLTEQQKTNGLINGINNKAIWEFYKSAIEVLSCGCPRNFRVADENLLVDCCLQDSEALILLDYARNSHMNFNPAYIDYQDYKRKALVLVENLKRNYKGINIVYFLSFPFEPFYWSESEITKIIKKAALPFGFNYFSKNEVLIGNEFWNYISAETDTIFHLKRILDNIATSEFISKYQFINEPKNKDKDFKRYTQILEEWYLFSDVDLCRRDEKIKSGLGQQTRAMRIYYQSLFNNEGYNYNRQNFLISL